MPTSEALILFPSHFPSVSLEVMFIVVFPLTFMEKLTPAPRFPGVFLYMSYKYDSILFISRILSTIIMQIHFET